MSEENKIKGTVTESSQPDSTAAPARKRKAEAIERIYEVREARRRRQGGEVATNANLTPLGESQLPASHEDVENPQVEMMVPLAVVTVTIGDDTCPGVVLEALPDTGASISAVSQVLWQTKLHGKYARLASTPNFAVRVGDSRLVKPRGRVNLPVTLGGKTVWHQFHILDGLPYDVVLAAGT